MQIDKSFVGSVTVLTLSGKITLGEGDEFLKDCINALAASGKLAVVMDLAGVPYIDSAGLGELVRSYTTLSRQGGKLILCSIDTQIYEVFEITKLNKLFVIKKDEQDGLQGF